MVSSLRTITASSSASLVGKCRKSELNPANVVVREADDAEVVVAEFDYRVHHRVTNRTFEAANIQVLRVRDGLIVSSRDFHDHLALVMAGGGLPELVAALEGKWPQSSRPGWRQGSERGRWTPAASPGA
ncbi:MULTISPECIES: nuclear transport factor 2 family protein [unclassified Streptomyces]|uniref:nuclear transport factor 2 family protein n=1 Tax=unclassified Streptomyces TaxID=2593676 RepID=UPI001BEA71D8|nr:MULTISPECIES: hypothetical protein [unclassified Streptomyces]MBT2406032.1 hypothetical protein [Streptomyces sp. ISL-21]MBT2453563.1 hypothetical protein [Streptomyces sp. ISL-86]MBT2610634.1 hypothetical protein [Streptomyces sp. ISL-87]